jgi:hypothetical protein
LSSFSFPFLIYKRYRKSKKQSRMDNPEKPVTYGTQDTGPRQTQDPGPRQTQEIGPRKTQDTGPRKTQDT